MWYWSASGAVNQRYREDYLNEFAFRFNRRKNLPPAGSFSTDSPNTQPSSNPQPWLPSKITTTCGRLTQVHSHIGWTYLRKLKKLARPVVLLDLFRRSVAELRAGKDHPWDDGEGAGKHQPFSSLWDEGKRNLWTVWPRLFYDSAGTQK